METLGDRGAAEDLAASYSGLFRELSGVFRARGLSGDEARDLAQESLVRTFVHLKRHGRTRPDLRPLAHTIARRLYVERGRRVRPRLVDLPQAEHLADAAPDPVEHVVSMEERQDVRDALASLAPRHRRAVSMSMRGLRPAEIARELGIKRNAADALLHRARRQLASKLSRHSALGLVVLLWGRARSGARAVADATSGVLHPTSTQYAPAAALAAAGIAALLLVTQPSQPDAGQDSGRAPSAQEIAEVTEPVASTTHRVAPERQASIASAPSLPIEPRERDIGFRADMGNGRELGAGAVYRETDDPGLLGPVLRKHVDRLCTGAVSLCQDSR